MTLNNSLIHWLSTFDSRPNGCSIDIKSSDDLADGLICSRVLHQIAPQFFTSDWLKRITPVPLDGSWRLRVSNLKRIVQKIQEYTNDVLNQPDISLPDVVVIAQNFDQDQIVRLLQLILCCAVNCDKKQAYINTILALPLQVQHDVMTAIQELLPRDANQPGSPSPINHNFNVNNNETTVITTNRNQTITTTTTTSPQNTARSHRAQQGEDGKSINRWHDESQMGAVPNRRPISGHHNDATSNMKHDGSNDCADKALSDELRRVMIDLETANHIKDEKSQACYELELKLKQLQLERDQLTVENERLSSGGRKLIKDHRNNDDGIHFKHSTPNLVNNTSHQQSLLTESLLLETTSENDSSTVRISRLQNQIQTLNDRLFKTETSKEEYRLKANLLQEDLDDLNRKYTNLLRVADQAQRLKDELDEHKHLVEKIATYESMIDNYGKKFVDYKKNVKALEEDNISHVRRNVELEEENKRLSSIVSHLDKYKRQIQDLQLKLSEESHRADKAECELSRMDEKYSLLKSENDRLIKDAKQFNTARKSMEEDKVSNLSSELVIVANNSDELALSKPIPTSNNNDLIAETAGEEDLHLLSMTNVPSNFKEKLVRLEHENRLLHKRIESDSQNNYAVLEALLEEAINRNTSLETENRNFKRQNLLLEGRLKGLLSSTQKATTSVGVSQLDIQRKVVDGSQYALQSKIEELEGLLQLREQELSKSEYRYKRNLQKAKQAVRALEQQTNNLNASSILQSSVSSTSSFIPSIEDFNILHQQIIERDRRIADLEREFSEFQRMKEIRERLILNALHGQGTSKQQPWAPAENQLGENNHMGSAQTNQPSSSFNSSQRTS